MKTYPEFLDEVAKENDYEDFMDINILLLEHFLDEAAKRYAAQCVKMDRELIYNQINPRFENGIDKIGFVYMDGLKELHKETEIILP